MDVISIRGMRVTGKHGVLPHEKEHDQPFDVDIELEVDLQRAAVSDSLSDTVDYAELYSRVEGLISSASFNLLERLAGEIVRLTFQDERVRRARVSIGKPNLLGGATPRVTISRER